MSCSDSGTSAEEFDAMKVSPESGREYQYTTIGEQVWMAENLNFATEYGFCYDNDVANCEIYGKLYSLTENDYPRKMIDTNKVDSICSPGWHLSSFNEMDKMINLVGGFDNEEAANKLKASTLWNEQYLGSDDCVFFGYP